MQHFRRQLAQCILIFSLLAGTAGAAAAGLSNQIVQSYTAGTTLQAGMIVELQTAKSQAVIPLSRNDSEHDLGVVVPANNASIVLTPASPAQQQVLVASTGQAAVLV